jgi:uncharacterized protein
LIHTFQFNDKYLVLDVESGALHILDELTFDILEGRAEGKYDAQAIQEAKAELEELRAAGYLWTSPAKVNARPASGTIKAMCLHIAHDCDLRCGYCFAGTGSFHGERMLMPFEVGKAALDFLIENSHERRNLEVDFFGGEPLLNFDVVKQLVAYGRALEKKYDKVFRFTITTNGTALTDEIIDYLNDEMSNVVISIDGRKEVHDAIRKTKDGQGSYDAIIGNAKKFVARRADKDYFIRGTFTRQNLDFAADALSLADEGFEQLSLEPVVLPESSPLALTEEHLDGIFKEYDKLASIMIERKRAGNPFAFFHFTVDLENGPCLQKRVTGCGAGGEYVAITPSGDIYPCHQFAGETGFKMGSVLTGEFDRDMQKRFQACNLMTKPECGECWAKYFCSGGCAANAYKYNGDIYKPHKLTCALERKRTECALGILVSEGETHDR